MLVLELDLAVLAHKNPWEGETASMKTRNNEFFMQNSTRSHRKILLHIPQIEKK